MTFPSKAAAYRCYAAPKRRIAMLPEKRTKTNVGVGMGVLLQLAGLFLAQTGNTIAILGLVLCHS